MMVTCDAKALLVFVKIGAEINQTYYEQHILKHIVNLYEPECTSKIKFYYFSAEVCINTYCLLNDCSTLNCLLTVY